MNDDALEEGLARTLGAATAEAGDASSTSESGELEELTPLSWPRLFDWAQKKDDTALDFRRKSLTASFLRALNLWFRYHADSAQRSDGVKLDQLFRWMWPHSEEKDMTTMFTWVCLHELGKIRREVPPVIDNHERRALETIFTTMAEGGDHCTPEDIAGGADVDKNDDATMRNIVDAGTVRAVAGEEAINPLYFLELMCEDDHRAHDDAGLVWCAEGGRIAKHSRPGLGIDVWLSDNPSKEERSQRKLVDAVEAEVCRWQQLAKKEAKPSTSTPLASKSSVGTDGQHSSIRQEGQHEGTSSATVAIA
jgi:hypothetical protein